MRPKSAHTVIGRGAFVDESRKPPKASFLQVMLIGQPELNAVLNSHEFRQLKQRWEMLPYGKPIGGRHQ